MKTCIACKESKPFEAFSKRAGAADGHRNTCKTCHNTYVREKWYPANADKHKEAVATYKAANKHKVVAARLGLDEGEVLTLLSETTCCAICETQDDLCVDHCHTTMQIRGRLCKRCNIAIGILGDSREIVLQKLRRIEEYLA